MSDFEKVKNLRQIITKAEEKINGNAYQLNFSLKVSCKIKKLTDVEFPEEAKLAEAFQNPKKPDNLYINHGQFIKDDGISHMISALKEKRNSNRALISLINQNDIIDSKDKPIPSFMSLQASIENHEELYITVYFRALEVSKFLKINLEELRSIINKIYEEFSDIKTVKLHIFSFRAYSDPDINPLIRPEIETLDQSTLLKILEKKLKERLIPLLVEKVQTRTTVVDDQSFSKILDILEDPNKNEDINTQVKSEYTKQILKKILKSSEILKELRAKDSHNPDIDELYHIYKNNIQELIDEIKKID